MMNDELQMTKGTLPESRAWRCALPPIRHSKFSIRHFPAWLQHIYHHLTPDGYAAVILANGSMSSNNGGEGEIRKAMIEGDAVDCMVAMPGQLFFGVQIPVCIWILARDKSGGKHGQRKLRDRRGEVLFLDARKLGHMITELSGTSPMRTSAASLRHTTPGARAVPTRMCRASASRLGWRRSEPTATFSPRAATSARRMWRTRASHSKKRCRASSLNCRVSLRNPPNLKPPSAPT